MKKEMIYKTLVMGVIFLFVGAGVQSVFAVEIPEKEEIEPKDFLFETIVNIADKPNFQDLIEGNENNFISSDFNSRYIFRQLLFKNPELLSSMVLSKPKMTTQYLNLMYDQGIELIDIFGEEKAIEMLESVEFSNPELLDDLNNMIMNDEDLSNRISTLIELNNQTSSICSILFVLGLRGVVKWISLNWLERIFRSVDILEIFFMARSWLVIPQVFIIKDLLIIFDCW